MKEWSVPCGTLSCATVSSAAVCVGPMMKFAVAPGWRQRPVRKLGRAAVAWVRGIASGRRGFQIQTRRIYENGADLSVVLAPGGTNALAPTQVGWAMAAGTIHVSDCTVPSITAQFLILGPLPSAPAVLTYFIGRWDVIASLA